MAAIPRLSVRLVDSTGESACRTRRLAEEFSLGQRQGGQERDADGEDDKVCIGGVAKNEVELGHGIKKTVLIKAGKLLMNPRRRFSARSGQWSF